MFVLKRSTFPIWTVSARWANGERTVNAGKERDMCTVNECRRETECKRWTGVDARWSIFSEKALVLSSASYLWKNKAMINM